ncbi:MAG: SPOR domain-containing protein [Gammaproteobacteria bacterium]|nr:SPOR domain-containing protein [Gammaproteobacteria bacterium]MDH3750454.1 SPOR domain-containing protein [Gammaproteobacteria bacterium]MDH3805802.1 SPOR domain-containing protein [Gammaproteobacteria bacterium]
MYVQIGAFGSRENAQRQLSRLRSGGIGIGFIKEDASRNPPLYRVRLGPIKGVLQYDILVEELENMGIMNPYLVTE